MSAKNSSKLIAVVGGSGAGKSWLVDRLCSEFGDEATALSLDDFYHDLSYLMPSDREKINFDHPDRIDWVFFEEVLRDLRNGLTATLPQYDFVTHTRRASGALKNSCPVVFVEGLWLLWPQHIRELFDLRIFLDCSEPVRWQRRLARDCKERGRTKDSVHEQFWNVVVPMHARFVEQQKDWADFVIDQPTSGADFAELLAAVYALQAPASHRDIDSIATAPESAVLNFL